MGESISVVFRENSGAVHGGERKEMKWDEREGSRTAAVGAYGRTVPECKRSWR